MTNKLQIKLILLRLDAFKNTSTEVQPTYHYKHKPLKVLKFLNPDLTLVIHLYSNIKSLIW